MDCPLFDSLPVIAQETLRSGVAGHAAAVVRATTIRGNIEQQSNPQPEPIESGWQITIITYQIVLTAVRQPDSGAITHSAPPESGKASHQLLI
jgi:hypothetical protein